MRRMLRMRWPVLVLVCAFALLAAGQVHAADPPSWVAALYIEAQKAVGLRFTPVAGATGYKVLRSTTSGSGYEEITSTSSPQFFDQTVEPGETYYYVLQSVAGAEVSANSAEQMVKIPGSKAVAVKPPKWVDSSVKQKKEFGKVTFKVNLTWVKDPNPSIVAYNVYRSETKGKDYQLVGSVSETAYVDTAVQENKTYYYVLSALDNAFQETAMSEEREVTLTAVKAKEKRVKVDNPKLLILKSKQMVLRTSGEEFQVKIAGDTAVDSEGNIYLADTGNAVVHVFSSDGTFQQSVGEKGQAEGQMQFPTGIGIDADDNLYITDRAAKPRIVVFDSGGRFLREIVIPPPTEEYMEQFTKKDLQPLLRDVAIGDDGRIYVVDNQLHRLLILDADGEIQKVVGGPGGDPGLFNAPGWVAINNGQVHITNGLNRRVEVFDLDGNFLFKYGESKSFIGSFVGATGIAFGENGYSMVVDSSAATIQFFGVTDPEEPDDWNYLFTMGDETGEIDKNSRQRSSWKVRNPTGVSYNPVTKQVVFGLNLDRAIVTYQILEDYATMEFKDY